MTLNTQDLLTRYSDLTMYYEENTFITFQFLDILEEELPLVEQQEPGFLQLLLIAVRAGKIEGDIFIDIDDDEKKTGCGCAYGQGTNLNEERAKHLAYNNHYTLFGEEREELGFSFTPLETLVLEVKRGDTPHTNRCLALLEELLLHFISTGKEEVQG